MQEIEISSVCREGGEMRRRITSSPAAAVCSSAQTRAAPACAAHARMRRQWHGAKTGGEGQRSTLLGRRRKKGTLVGKNLSGGDGDGCMWAHGGGGGCEGHCRMRMRGSTTVMRAVSEKDDARTDPLEVVVVGGGVSGLAAAVALLSGPAALPRGALAVTEARNSVGGNITTRSGGPGDGGYLWEEGPNSFQPSDAVLRMAVDVGLRDDLVLGDPTAPRFVLWDGALRKVPSSPLDFIKFELISILGSVRAGLGAIGLRPSPPPPEEKEETVKEFVTRNLGDEVFQKLIEPFCSGVYAGNPEKLSMRAAFGKIVAVEDKGGSLIAGALKLMQERASLDPPPPPRDADLPPKPKGQTVGSFRKGLAMLPQAMRQFLGEDSVKTGTCYERRYMQALR